MIFLFGMVEFFFILGKEEFFIIFLGFFPLLCWVAVGMKIKEIRFSIVWEPTKTKARFYLTEFNYLA